MANKSLKGSSANGIEIVDLSDLKVAKQNARKHTPRNISTIANSIQEVGAARSGVIDEKNELMAGNGTYEALVQAGIRRVKVIEANGEEWVVVRRRGLSEKQKRRLALGDNRTSELSLWDVGVLEELQLEDAQIFKGLFEDRELFFLGLGGDANDPNASWRGMPEFSQDDQSAWKSLIVHFRSPEDFKAFTKLLDQAVSEATRSIWYPEAERADNTTTRMVGES